MQSATTIGQQIDGLFWLVTFVAVFFTAGIFTAMILLAVRYRQGSKVDRSHPQVHNTVLEITWTAIPLVIALSLFAAAAVVYFRIHRPPPDAMELHVVGKQWMWKVQHPSGRWENNSLHVPAGRPVKLILTSEDVLHSFYVPQFRLKMDVVPGRFSEMWFVADKPGTYNLFCAEYCGTLHSQMGGFVTVMDGRDYERWLVEGNVRETAAAEGAQLFRKHGCSGCHSANSSVRAPMLEGIYGRPRPVQIPEPGKKLEEIPATTVVANARYIHDAIVLPEREIAAGYRNIMPTFKNRITEEEILKITSYLRSLSANEPGRGARQDHSREMGPEDYEARTGFVPDNLEQIRAGQQGRSPEVREPR